MKSLCPARLRVRGRPVPAAPLRISSALCPSLPAVRPVPRLPAVLSAAVQRLLQEHPHHHRETLWPQQLLIGNHFLSPRGRSQPQHMCTRSEIMAASLNGRRWNRRLSNLSKSPFPRVEARLEYFGTVFGADKSDKRMYCMYSLRRMQDLLYSHVGLKCPAMIDMLRLFYRINTTNLESPITSLVLHCGVCYIIAFSCFVDCFRIWLNYDLSN